MSEQSSTSAITKADVEHVAALASLALTPEELDRMGKDLGSILEYVAALQQLDTTGVAPLTQVSELFSPSMERESGQVLRSDEPRPSLSREVVMGEAPASDGTFFKVPKVIER